MPFASSHIESCGCAVLILWLTRTPSKPASPNATIHLHGSCRTTPLLYCALGELDRVHVRGVQLRAIGCVQQDSVCSWLRTTLRSVIMAVGSWPFRCASIAHADDCTCRCMLTIAHDAKREHSHAIRIIYHGVL